MINALVTFVETRQCEQHVCGAVFTWIHTLHDDGRHVADDADAQVPAAQNGGRRHGAAQSRLAAHVHVGADHRELHVVQKLPKGVQVPELVSPQALQTTQNLGEETYLGPTQKCRPLNTPDTTLLSSLL